MKNWSTDTKRLKKDKSSFSKWKLEQFINFGLDGVKISQKELVKWLPKLSIDPYKKKYLQFLLHGKKNT